MKTDPFECTPVTCGDKTFRPRVITADERLRVVRDASADTLRIILTMQDLQATVRRAAEARLRKLEGVRRRA